MTPAAAPSTVELSSRTGRAVVLAAVLGSGLAMLDGSVVNVALRTIGTDLDATLAELQWINNAYLLTLASFILLGGSLGDRFGRRRIFVVGTVWFALASLLCGIAPNPEVMVGARLLQGVGAALLTPGSLAMIQGAFVPADRGKAIGTWSGLGSVFFAVGPFIGGALVDYASWRWIFLINLPLAVATVLVAAALGAGVARPGGRSRPRPDRRRSWARSRWPARRTPSSSGVARPRGGRRASVLSQPSASCCARRARGTR